MATKATISGYLNGYPQLNGNHKKVAALLNGPTDYDAGGVAIPDLRHVANLHEIQVVSCSPTYSVYVVVNTSNPVFRYSDVLLFFVAVATGVQPADNTDLSAIKVRIVVEGTN